MPFNLIQNKMPSLWKQILRKNFTKIDSFSDYLNLDEDQKRRIVPKPKFILNVPFRLAEKIKKGTLDDPILRQFLPMNEELTPHPDFLDDPVGDHHSCISPKLLQKYQGRVLLISTSACAMHCRYCFRQHFDYQTDLKEFSKEIEMITNDPSIHEVILSGGDPLSLDDSSLQNLLEPLNSIAHVKRIRFHSRFPIGIPERIDDSFIELIRCLNKQVYFVIHANHPLELDHDVLSHLKKLQLLGCTLLNQSVLLKGVNDDFSTLKELCEKLVDNGIMPYYLHQLDRVQGGSHFEVPPEQGLFLISELLKHLPGYAVPKYVKENAGELSKTPLT